MSKTPAFDQRIADILAATKPGERICALTGEKWIMTDEEIGWYKKFNVPPSPFSPYGRILHLASMMTVYQWWWNKHFETGAPVLTYVHPATGIRALPDKEWFDKDFSSINFQFSTERPFFEMFRELQLKVPVNATRNVVEPENSITTVSFGGKNSLFAHASRVDNSCYTADIEGGDRCVDCNGGADLVECYHTNHCQRLHRCAFAYESLDCMQSEFIFDCRDCEYCFGAWNQRHKKYLWWNEQLSETEWKTRRDSIDLGKRSELETNKNRFLKIVDGEALWPENWNVQCEECTGDYLTRCTRCQNCLLGYDATDNWWCMAPYHARGNAFAIPIRSENNYQSGMIGDSANTKFSSTLIRCDDLEYCFNCYDCSHCFGCVGLRHKSFHIFNKPYPETEYWEKVDALKCAMLDRGEYGRPLPTSYSFAFYPESGVVMYVAGEPDLWDKTNMPHFNAWDDGAYGAMRLENKQLRTQEEVPDNVDALTDDWVGKPILDKNLNRPFAFLKPEAEFYRAHRISPPREHFIARMKTLLRSSNSILLENAACALCRKPIQASKNPNFTHRRITCRACYLKQF